MLHITYKDNYDRQLHDGEVHNWVEQAIDGNDMTERVKIGNAGYPIMLSEVTAISATDDFLFDAKVRQISISQGSSYGPDYITGVATEEESGWSFLVFFSDYDTQWYIQEYGPEDFYGPLWMPSVGEEQRAFNYSV